MSLILAIEPDRRQVAHLVSIVRHVQGAELILADTTERALESIGNSVPDLILVPALLSPQDDAALAAALRVIASAAHVQMLTIPTFATPKPAAKKGVLSAFRRKSSNDAPIEGCDPKVFAEEIASYIERANEERAAAQYYEDDQDVVQAERSREKVTTSEDAFVAAFDEPEPEPQTAFESAQTESTYREPAYHAPDYTPVAQVEDATYHYPDYTPVAQDYTPDVQDDASADVWAEPAAADEPVVEDAAEARPIFGEVFETSEPEPAESAAQMVDVEDVQTAAEATTEDLPHHEAAIDEHTATLLHDAEEIEVEAPLAAAPEPITPVVEVAEIEQAPAFEDMLADLERTNLPVIEEVEAEPWMAETVDAMEDEEVDAFDEADDLDIDLSIELDAVLHAEKPANAPEPAQALKPFEPVVPVERVEPLPLAAWQAWPRLDWAPPEGAARQSGNGNGHEGATPAAVELAKTAESQEARETAATLERFEPVVPVERVEPMPMAAWLRWPRMEGVAAETYQEPIAPRKAAAKPEWVELMRSLREDIARRRAELNASEPDPAPAKPQTRRPLAAAAARVRAAKAVAKPAVKPAPAPPPVDPASRPKRTRPIEDEWGLFDPEQCGFAALLDKLDEITVTPPAPPPRRPGR
jgi:hypothetical protein